MPPLPLCCPVTHPASLSRVGPPCQNAGLQPTAAASRTLPLPVQAEIKVWQEHRDNLSKALAWEPVYEAERDIAVCAGRRLCTAACCPGWLAGMSCVCLAQASWGVVGLPPRSAKAPCPALLCGVGVLQCMWQQTGGSCDTT